MSGAPRQGLTSGSVPGWSSRAAPVAPYVVGVLPGEGIGPEVIDAALRVLDAAADAYGLTFEVRRAGDLGSGAYGSRLTDDVGAFFASTFAAGGPVLCGPAGGRFVYELRARFDLYCKLVPVRPSPALADASILRPDRLAGIDVVVVRENIGGLYQGSYARGDGGRTASQSLTYTADQVDRVMQISARLARARRGRLTVVGKSGGIPEVSALWWERAEAAGAAFHVSTEALEVDNAGFQLVAEGARFDVVVAPNMLGDVVADTATLVLGSRGMAFSANVGDDGTGVYQTGHGAAYDIAGTDRANPVAMILSLAMLLRESLWLPEAATSVEDAVETVLADGYRTPDIAAPGSQVVGTGGLASRIADSLAPAGARHSVA
jgi:3-isopropylmalate dehydrogenase